MFYSNIFALRSSNFQFLKVLGNLNKSPLDATAQSLFIVKKDHKSTEVITLKRDSCENVVRQAALEQRHEIENCCSFFITSYHPLSLLITPYNTLSLRLERK